MNYKVKLDINEIDKKKNKNEMIQTMIINSRK